jgi:dihydroflavonol-4-reductase
MRIAIIGATGMLGHHTALAASRAGHEVIVVYRNPRSLEAIRDFRFEARQADLNDRHAPRSAFKRVDSVINCAGYYPTVPRPWRDEMKIAEEQMQNFYDACADLPLPPERSRKDHRRFRAGQGSSHRNLRDGPFFW